MLSSLIKTVVVSPKPQEPYTGPIYPSRILLKIIKIPDTVEYFVQPSFEVTLRLLTNGTSYHNVTITFWITDSQNNRVYESNMLLLFKERKDVTLYLPIPHTGGTYTFNAKAVSLTLVSNIVSKDFTVTVHPLSSIIQFVLAPLISIGTYASSLPLYMRVAIIMFIIAVAYLIIINRRT